MKSQSKTRILDVETEVNENIDQSPFLDVKDIG